MPSARAPALLDLPISVASAPPSRKVEEVGPLMILVSLVPTALPVLYYHLPLSRPGMMEKLGVGRERGQVGCTLTPGVLSHHNPPVGRLQQQELISHSPGGWSARAKVGDSCFL